MAGSRNGKQSRLIMTSDFSLSMPRLQLTRQLQSPSDCPKCVTSSSFQLRLAVTVIISVGNILTLIAITTDYWIHGHNKKTDKLHIGLWKICIQEVCTAHYFIIYSKIILVVAMVIGILCNIVAVVALVFGKTYFKGEIARTMFIKGVAAVVGMGSATHFLINQTVYQSIGYSLVLGWIGAFMYPVAALVSLMHHRIEPDTGIKLDDTRQLVSESTTQEPS